MKTLIHLAPWPGSDLPLLGRGGNSASRVRSPLALLAAIVLCLTATASAASLSVLRSFDSPEFASPSALVEGSDGALYGTTSAGGESGSGTVFKVNKDGTGYAVLRSLDAATDGASPASGLTRGSGGNLYGTALVGGSEGFGTLFRISEDGLSFVVLHSFGLVDGANPYARVTRAAEDTGEALYGTTVFGGQDDLGTVYRYGLSDSSFSSLKSFDGSGDGGVLVAGVVVGIDGRLYGAASEGGGVTDAGTVFTLKKDGTDFSVLRSFSSATDGENLQGGVIQGSDGALYGTAFSGGMASSGTVFRLSTDGLQFDVLKSFSAASDGSLLYAGVTERNDGVLYGTASQGGSGDGGTVYRLQKDGTNFEVIAAFNSGTTGPDDPRSPVSFGSDQHLYATSYAGGDFGRGTVFVVELGCLDTLAPVPDVATLPAIAAECEALRPSPPTATDACEGPITATTDAPPTFGQGDFTIVWTFTDSKGNSSTQQQLVSVHDTTPPSMGPCPADFIVDAVSPAGAVVTFATPVASDNCSVTVTCNPPSGSIFPIGTTTVTCTATDIGGNTIHCTFSIRILGAAEQTQNLIDLLEGTDIRPVLKSVLSKKLTSVLASLTSVGPASSARKTPSRLSNAAWYQNVGDEDDDRDEGTTTPCRRLDQFIQKVNELNRRRIDPADAAALTEAARLIQAVLGC